MVDDVLRKYKHSGASVAKTFELTQWLPGCTQTPKQEECIF